MENHNYCIFPFNYFRLDVRKPHVFVYFSPLFTSLSEIHYGNESFCIREPLIPISHNLFWFFTPAANFFSWRLVYFFKDFFNAKRHPVKRSAFYCKYYCFLLRKCQNSPARAIANTPIEIKIFVCADVGIVPFLVFVKLTFVSSVNVPEEFVDSTVYPLDAPSTSVIS